MPHGKPRDPAKEQLWRQRLQRWHDSGLSVRAFCQRHRLAVPSFYAWRRTLRQRDAQSPPTTPPVAFVPLAIQPDHATDPPPPLELVLANGRCLRIPPGAAPAHLRDLVRVLEETPC